LYTLAARNLDSFYNLKFSILNKSKLKNMRKKSIKLLPGIAAIILESCVTSNKICTFSYTNPITRDSAQSMRDPVILKNGNKWYMTGTSQPIGEGPNPGVRLMVSDDLLHWRDSVWIIDASKLSKDCPYRGRFYAPEIYKMKDYC